MIPTGAGILGSGPVRPIEVSCVVRIGKPDGVGRVVDTADLVVPHPRMHERSFVLVPLLELDPDPMLPGGRSIGELRPGAGFAGGGVRVFAPPLV